MVSTQFEQTHRYLMSYETDDESDGVSATGLMIGFSILSLAFVVNALLIIRCNWHSREFYEWNAIRLIMPGTCLCLAIVNATLAYDYERTKIPTFWTIVIYMIKSTIAPGIYMFTFIMTFLAHRTRSIPFCFVHRGPGRSETRETQLDEEDEVYQPLVRPALLVVFTRIFALGLFLCSLLVDLDVIDDDSLVGQTGWAWVANNSGENVNFAIIISLLPMTLVAFLCLYFACLLWRYGSEFSMVIPKSSVNAWIFPVIGALAMITGQMFGPDLYLIASNSGILIYMMTMTRTLYEIRHDIAQTGELGHFLQALESSQKREVPNVDSTPSAETKNGSCSDEECGEEPQGEETESSF
eukprot:CAMPEP_0172393348 /NCGR_PEP_ID=MMETSP1061-20121228/9228_1 /TAXON_ID=37318 /ORGANISM="Pseudo-nitzschia pungens, Strain cf. pungens" /LENGTH=353 /DNA_ID=CAMNT_0013124385 /DNA_START=128 /DNA_END=1189 /DNA_ORIENTATION=-